MTVLVDAHLYDVPVEGGSLRVARWGAPPEQARPVVIAAHGITSSHLFWALVGAALGDDVTLLAPDLRGRGDSARLPGPFGMAAHARDLIAVLDFHAIPKAVVAGHSMGGFVAAVLGARAPERVDGTLLVDGGPSLVPDTPDEDQVAEVLDAVVGPALRRLRKRYATVEEYESFWSEHPSMTAAPDELVTAYAAHDLAGPEGALHSKVGEEATLADGRDTLMSADVRMAFAALEEPVVLLVAERGVLDQAEPLYGDEALAAVQTAAPHIRIETVPSVNHYTIGMSERGAAVIAEQLRAMLKGAHHG
ncbi:MAG: alpha/beta hydrolase [Egibacteraceae bacterium]